MALSFGVILVLATFWQAEAAEVVVVKSRNLKLFDQVLEGFRSVYKKPIDVLTLGGELADSERLAATVRGKGARVVLAIGAGALKLLRKSVNDLPVVFCMIPGARGKKLVGGNVTGVDMETPPEQQLKAFAELMPRVKRIGLVFNKKFSGTMVRRAARAASELGLVLVAVPVEERKEVPRALDKVVENSDALWLIRDPVVMSRELFKRALMVQFEKRKPLLVQSALFVKRQATCSFAASYRSQGVKAADIVQRLLAGTPVADIPLQSALGHLSVNIKAARKAGVELNQQVLSQPGVEKF